MHDYGYLLESNIGMESPAWHILKHMTCIRHNILTNLNKHLVLNINSTNKRMCIDLILNNKVRFQKKETYNSIL